MNDEWITSFQIRRLMAEYRSDLCYPGRAESFLWPKLAAGQIAVIAGNATVKASGRFGKTTLAADWEVPPACFDPERRRAHLDLVNDSFTTRAGIRGLDRADCRFLRFERESLLDAIGVGEESHIGPNKSAGDSCAPLDRNAPSAINSDKEAADAVAARQREVGGKVSAILRELYPSGSRNRSTESTHAAIRKALNYYYDKEGVAKK